MCIGVTTAYPGRFAVTNEDDEYYYNFFSVVRVSYFLRSVIPNPLT